MKNKPFIYFGVFLFLVAFLNLFPAILFAQSLSEAEAAAESATRRLEEALGGGIGSMDTIRNEVPSQIPKGGPKPRWVSDAYSVYTRSRYIAAVGFAANRAEAEKKALATLAAIFGLSVQSDFSVATIYSEAIQKGIVTVSENTVIRDIVVTATLMDTLIGAEIGNVWENEHGIVYAVAYMDREKTILIYTEMIRINNRNIENLITMSAAQKNTFDGYARYRLAALISGINTKYAKVIVQAGGSTASLITTSADSLNLEASNILKNISVSLNITGDRNNHIRSTFANILNSEGLRTHENDSPYTLDATLSLTEVTLPNNRNKFCHYTISANFTEKSTGLVLLHFNLTDRVSHLTYNGAAARAITVVEKKIKEQYPVAFRQCLVTLLPQN